MDRISRHEIMRLNFPVRCELIRDRVTNLAEYFEVLTPILNRNITYWFRGHYDITWTLVPSALRFNTKRQRQAALNLLEDFRRIAEIKLDRPPRQDEALKWLQLAQHYGIPTRLLDWTESAIFALYFATVLPADNQIETNGIVFLINPEHLSSLAKLNGFSHANHVDDRTVERYLRLGPNQRANGTRIIAIKPIWNSERLMMQRGVFTLHGSKRFDLDNTQAPSLVGIPILKDSKERLRNELNQIGIDEMTIFPELEHACNCLKKQIR
jgi:hypothetical protein